MHDALSDNSMKDKLILEKRDSHLCHDMWISYACFRQLLFTKLIHGDEQKFINNSSVIKKYVYHVKKIILKLNELTMVVKFDVNFTSSHSHYVHLLKELFGG